MIKVWADATEAGLLDRHGNRGSSFAYLPKTDAARAVSVTMPVRLPSWTVPFRLLPIFEMNLPEGFLRERLRLAFAKATGKFDELDLLSVVGRSQVGRIRYTGAEETLNEEVPFQSVDEILGRQRSGDLFRYLIEKFAAHSGISGVQPKILIRDGDAFHSKPKDRSRISQSYRGATHIVKLWEPDEYPQLAANEYFCLSAARRCGLDVPTFRLSEDGLALVLDRFDLRPDGTYRGFEDFCVLNALRTEEKYRGSYETALFKRFASFADPAHLREDAEKLFALVALNCALRNGDAHLKNFGVIYDSIEGPARLAPVYDLVTTTVYVTADRLALTLNGSTKWPTGKELRRLGEVRAGLTPSRAAEILESVAEAITATMPELNTYARQYIEFAELGKRMLQQWELGVATSLRG